METRKTTYTEHAEVIEISMPSDRRRADVREVEQHRFIIEHWESFAAAAFEGFKRFGIGAVVIEDQAQEAGRAMHPFSSHQIWYATGFDAWMQQPSFSEAAVWVRHQFETYDPREACVFIFLHEHERPRAYVVEGSLKPPEALARLKALLN